MSLLLELFYKGRKEKGQERGRYRNIYILLVIFQIMLVCLVIRFIIQDRFVFKEVRGYGGYGVDVGYIYLIMDWVCEKE